MIDYWSWMWIGIFLLVITGLGLTLLIVGSLLRPSRPSDVKATAYESGVPTLFGDARVRYSARFYILAVLFVLFDIEVIFIFPWAVAFEALGGPGFLGMLAFILLLLLGYVHAWRKGAFEWA
jgi:NADH-quinone oxidoreductase subunit A